MFFICIATIIHLPFGLAADFLKFPENITFKWDHNMLYAYTNDQPAVCFQMQLQIKSNLETHWQNPLSYQDCKIEKPFRCSSSNLNLDPEKCYIMQAKFKINSFCHYESPESRWGPMIFLRNGTILENCTEKPIPKRLITQVSTVLPIIVCAVVLLACLAQRLKTCALPTVPDAKHIFYGLFEDHSGNFQQWVTKGHEEMPYRNDAPEEIVVVKWESEENIRMKFCQDP